MKEEVKMSKIDYAKLKEDMDVDGDFEIDQVISAEGVEPYEEVVLTRSGDEFSTEYLIQIDTHIEDEDDYKLVDEFGSTLSEIERAVDCYLKTGGTISSFERWSV